MSGLMKSVRSQRGVTLVELLAALVETCGHPLISAALAARVAGELRTAASDLQTAIDRLRPVSVRQKLLKARSSVNARQAQIQLVRLKSRWKSDGVSEHDIHQIIPDHPRSRSRDDAEPEPTASEPEASPEPTTAKTA